MSIRSCFVIFLVGYVITSVASVPICPIHGLSTCPCSNTIFSPTCGSGSGNVCSQCRGYPMSPPSKAYYNKPSPHDLYSCSTVVRPAFVPETCPCNCHETPPILDKDSYEESSDSPKKQRENNPVDPVSLMLAQKLLDKPKRRIPESKIWFCPKKAVLNDMPKKKIRKNIPEERLFAMERDVIELKPSKSKWGYWNDGDNANESDNSDSSSSEKANSGSSESDEVSDEVKQTEVTYKKIGYDHIKVNDAKREKNAIKLLPPITLDERWAAIEDRHDLQSLPFVPGEVTIRKRKIKSTGSSNSVESYEDLSNQFQSIVKNSQIKLFRNVLNPLGFNPFLKLSGNLCL